MHGQVNYKHRTPVKSTERFQISPLIMGTGLLHMFQHKVSSVGNPATFIRAVHSSCATISRMYVPSSWVNSGTTLSLQQNHATQQAKHLFLHLPSPRTDGLLLQHHTTSVSRPPADAALMSSSSPAAAAIHRSASVAAASRSSVCMSTMIRLYCVLAAEVLRRHVVEWHNAHCRQKRVPAPNI